MAKAVVILGAGASADFGVPTLSRIFTDHAAQQYLHQNTWLHDNLQKFFWEPRGASLQTSSSSLTIEEMLTILKDWETGTDLPSVPIVPDLNRFRKGLYILIKKAIFDSKNSRAAHLNPLIDTLNAKYEHVTWASFNWDCIFEASFWYSQPFYGPGSRVNPHLTINLQNWFGGGAPKHTYLKLHGSINWWLMNNRPTYLRFASAGDLDDQWKAYEDNKTGADSPIILEPCCYKYGDPLYDLILKPQWDELSKKLDEADHIIICGYSFPESDAKARLYLTTAFHINQKSKWLVIDPSKNVCDRYRRLFGEKKFTILEVSLAGFNSQIEANLNAAFPSDV